MSKIASLAIRSVDVDGMDRIARVCLYGFVIHKIVFLDDNDDNGTSGELKAAVKLCATSVDKIRSKKSHGDDDGLPRSRRLLLFIV